MLAGRWVASALNSCFIQVFPIRMVARLHYAEAYLYPQEMLHGWKGIFKCSER